MLIPFSVIYHLANFYAFILNDFRLNPEATFANGFLDFIIIPVSNVPLNVKKKEENKNLIISRTKIDEMKSIFQNF